MADQKISQLTTESSLSGTYYFPVIKYNTGTSMYDNYKVDVSLFITSDDLDAEGFVAHTDFSSKR